MQNNNINSDHTAAAAGDNMATDNNFPANLVEQHKLESSQPLTIHNQISANSKHLIQAPASSCNLPERNRTWQEMCTNGGGIGTNILGEGRRHQSLKQKNIRNTFSNIKLRIAASKLVNQTNTRAYKNLTQYQQYLINDQSNASSFGNVDNLNAIMNKKQSSSALIQFLINTQEQTMNYAKNTYKRIKDLKKTSLGSKMEQCWKKIPVISPSNVYKIVWDGLLLMFIMIYIFLVPIHIGFETPFEKLITPEFSQFGPIIFILDILIQLNTGYFNKGIPISNKIQIIRHFLKNCLVTDVISVMPYVVYHYSKGDQSDYISRYQPENNDMQIGKFFLLLFFLKLKRFTDIVRRLSEITHLSEKAGNFIRLIRLLFTIVIIAHILTCTWIYVAVQEAKMGSYSWIDAQQLARASWNQQYLRSLYFTIVSMITVGYGDVTPKTDAEYIVCIGMIILSCGVYAYTFNEIGNILKEFNRNKDMMNANMRVINYYMHHKNISRTLQYQVREYLEYYWTEVQDRDKDREKAIIEQLSDQLREALQFEANKVIVQNSKVFSSNFSERLLQKTVQLIREKKYNPEQIILQSDSTVTNIIGGSLKVGEDTATSGLRSGDGSDNDGSDSIYFVEKGSVEIFFMRHVPGKPNQYFPIQTLTKGQNFGADCFFTGQKSIVNIRSKEFTTLLQIRRDDFLTLLKDFPDDYEQFCSIQDNIHFYSNYHQIGYYCPACGSTFHCVRYCPLIHYFPKKEKILRQYNKLNNNYERSKHERNANYPRVKFRTLSNISNTHLITVEYQEENEELITYHLQQQKLSKLEAMEDKLKFSKKSGSKSFSLFNSIVQANWKRGTQALLHNHHSPHKGPISLNSSSLNSNQKKTTTNLQKNHLDNGEEDQVMDQQKQLQSPSAANSHANTQEEATAAAATSGGNANTTPAATISTFLHKIDETDYRQEEDTHEAVDSKTVVNKDSDSNEGEKKVNDKNNQQTFDSMALQNSNSLRIRRRGSMLTPLKKLDEPETTKPFSNSSLHHLLHKEQEFSANFTEEKSSNQNQHILIMEKLEKSVQKIQDQLAASQQIGEANKTRQSGRSQSLDFSSDFESFKNFTTYFPYNNLNYQVQLLKLDPKDRSFFSQRMHLDNTLYNRKTFNEKQKFYLQFMNKLIEAQQQEELEKMQKQIASSQDQQQYIQQQQIKMMGQQIDMENSRMQDCLGNALACKSVQSNVQQQRESRLQKANEIFSIRSLQNNNGNIDSDGKQQQQLLDNTKGRIQAHTPPPDQVDRKMDPAACQRQEQSFHLINISFDTVRDNQGDEIAESESKQNLEGQKQSHIGINQPGGGGGGSTKKRPQQIVLESPHDLHTEESEQKRMLPYEDESEKH